MKKYLSYLFRQRLISLWLILFCTVNFAFAGKVDSIMKVLAKLQDRDTNYISTLNQLGLELQSVGNYERSVHHLTYAIKLSDSLNYQPGLAISHNNLGNAFNDMGDYNKSLDHHLKALSIREKLNDDAGIANSYLNTGNVYMHLAKPDLALDYYERSLNLYKKIKSKLGVAICYGNMGLIYNNAQKYAQAEDYYNRSIEIRKELKDTTGVADCYTNISIMYMDQGLYEKALDRSLKALEMLPNSARSLSKNTILSNIGDIYLHLKNYDKCIEYENAAIEMALKIRSKLVLAESYRLIYNAYKEKGDMKNALDYFDKYIIEKDSILNEDNLKNINEMETKFETDKKVREITLLQKNKSIDELSLEKQAAATNRQQFWLVGIAGGILIAIIAGLYLLFGFINKVRTNRLLLEKNGAINEQKIIIEQKNETITMGFNYAKTIQDKIIPSEKSMSEHCGEHFVLFQPKDIVSGDFYWTKKIKPKDQFSFLAAIDCTGHGVPGALMSLHAYDILEKIAKEKKINEPAHVLDELNSAIKNEVSENTNAGTEKFGMDMSVITIDRKKMELQFAGARNSVLIVRADRSLIELKADRVTIGSATEEFTNHTLLLQKGDMIYLFTDGYADQIGGPQRKKYLTGNFKNLLLSVSDKGMEEQKNILAKTHHDWMGNFTQTDDVMVIGIRV